MAGSVAARRLEAVMKSGGLVADEVINQLIFDRLAEPDTFAGFVLDGFPRTAAQAEALDQFVGDPAVVAVVLHVPEIENRAPLDRAACLFPVPDAAITKQPQLQAMRMCLLWRHARTPRR